MLPKLDATGAGGLRLFRFDQPQQKPWGALLAGDGDFIAEALRVRQRLGGGIRPTAIVCAAALAALESFDHIHDDHRRAKQIALAISQFSGVATYPEPQTNIVFVSLEMKIDAAYVVEKLRKKGILLLPFGTHRFRIVTHRGIDDEMAGYALTKNQRCSGSLAPGLAPLSLVPLAALEIR